MKQFLKKAGRLRGWLCLAGLVMTLVFGAGARADDPADVPAGAGVPAQTQSAGEVPKKMDATPVAVDKPAGVSAAGHAADKADEHEAGGAHHGPPHAIWILPFVLLLASIALCPLINQHWWEHHYHYVAIALGAVTAVYYLGFHGDAHPWYHAVMEYVSFIALLASLYVVSGGIVIQVGSRATPAANTALLLVGAVIANIFGTTGASMLLIRPFIRMNKGHIKPYHVVFFIFVVSNLGGALTPIGDPPLFLGYLQGIPFTWTLEHLWPLWAVANGLLLVVFFVIDSLDHKKQERKHEDDPGSVVKISGFVNFVLIGLVLVGVFRPSVFEYIGRVFGGTASGADYALVLVSREVLMVAAAVISLVVTPRVIHERNQFNWGPIREVAILFIGIFSTMVPALSWLENNAKSGEGMPLKTPGQYYFATGVLSSVLDNAPTYLVFLTTRLGMLDQEHVNQAQMTIQEMSKSQKLVYNTEGLPVDVVKAVNEMIHDHGDHIMAGTVTRREVELAFLLGNLELNAFIIAVSAGAVFFGAMTYIGNGPNFMVKSIAESSGVQMPSFFGYVLRFALPILAPILVLIWLIFFVMLG